MQFLPSRYGMLSVHNLADGSAELSPLVCLHPVPFDGTYFADFANRLAGDSMADKRRILAPDYPGYGNSDAPAAQPTVEDYAAALLTALKGLITGPMHLLGFHTGCLVACEMSLQSPNDIADLVLIDAPYHDPATQKQKYAANVSDDPATWGFGAAYTYPCAEKLASVSNRTLLIATGADLGKTTVAAAALMPQAQLETHPEITRPAFVNGGEIFARSIGAFLHG